MLFIYKENKNIAKEKNNKNEKKKSKKHFYPNNFLKNCRHFDTIYFY